MQGGLVEKLVARGIGPHHFEDPKNRAVYQTVVGHMTKYGAPPTRAAVLDAHPGYTLDVEESTIDFLIDKFVYRAQMTEGKRAVLDLAEALDQPGQIDVDKLFIEHAERVANVIPTSSVSRLSDAHDRIALYNKMVRTGRIPGVPLGIPTLDEQYILGVQNHEFVVIAAPSSGGKSTMLQYNALAAYLDAPQHKPVFISLEMEGEALLRKFDTMATNFQYKALRALELGEGDLRKWEEWGERVANAPNDIIIIDDIDECSVERVYAEVLRWKPSAMYVDYFGIMTPGKQGKDSQQWQGMAAMAKAMKRIPRRTGIPLFTAGQTNRDSFRSGVTADKIADTIELFRSADIMLALEWDEEEKPDEMLVKLLKMRDGKKGQTTMHWDMEHLDFYEENHFGRKSPPDQVASTNPDLLAGNPFA